jgi:hypothetical protein
MLSLFDEHDEPIAREVAVPETLASLKSQFLHRWAFNRTALEDMAPELDELIAYAQSRRPGPEGEA